jgi:exodeoxyribonuclease V gamma subunit
MSTLFLGSDPRTLADRLADELDRQAKAGDFFVPATIVVPNRYLRKWLRLWLARKLNVAINLQFDTLEIALWNLLRETDPHQAASPAEPIDENIYRLMMLSVLLEEKNRDLAVFQRYLQREGPALSRLSCRRAWHLADRIGLLIRDYEYARQDALIQRWLKGESGLPAAGAFHQMMERAQRALFTAVTREPDGTRARLNRHSEKTYKTFPQYAMERMLDSAQPLRPGSTVHFFGFTEVCDLHARTIAWLGRCFDVRFYHLNVLASRLVVHAARVPEKEGTQAACPTNSLKTLAQEFREPAEAESTDRGRELLRLWGRAGAESLELMAPLVADGGFNVEWLAAATQPKRSASVLSRLRDHLLGHESAKTRLPQDTSLQIVGCPTIAREVETVYASIVYNLQSDPKLRQTDIAVIVTDMQKYRAALQATFERPPRRVQYNMVDFSAASASMFGQALLGMIDLALESFSRSRVFAVLLNPCFLTRLGIDRAQAMAWLDWAESLGIYQGWDADEKAQQGYARSHLYSWRLGLQRLRLGRYMDVTADDAAEPAQRFAEVIPFADLGSTEREQLDAFCRAVEGLLPALAHLRTAKMSGGRWARELRRLVQEFLDVPADRAEEGQVRAQLLAGIEKLSEWDALHDAAHATRPPTRLGSPMLPLALVREYVQSQLQSLQGNRGEYLVGGVSIAELQPMRPVPFAIVYVLGLGENLFPGSNALSSFDLRGVQRLPGDIRPAEARVYDLLATVLSADKKLYLSYNNRDLQKDQPLLPAVPLVQWQRYLTANVLMDDFQTVTMPLHADDARYLDPAGQPEYQDVLVQIGAERFLAVCAARREKRLALNAAQETEWARQWQSLRKDFALAPVPAASAGGPANVTLTELRRFLHLPAQESLRRHLRVDEEDEQALEDHEPLVTSRQAANALVRQTVQQIILSAAHSDVDAALADWKERFTNAYADARLRSRAPEEAFGEIDQAALVRELQERIHGQGQIEAFLREHAGSAFCGPVLLGEALTPLGARLRFPALAVKLSETLHARLVGWTHLAWQTPQRFEIMILSNSEKIDGDKINLPMIEPALLHLALLASTEPKADGIIAQSWLAKREVLLHIAHPGGIQTWAHPAGSITPAEATSYLVELTRDFLQLGQFDLLPFDLLRERLDLRQVFSETTALQIAPEDYRNLLIEAIEEARENTFSGVRIPLLVEMIRADVPADALEKVQRRFRLLDRGPGHFRQQPRISKAKRAAKS